MPIIRDPEHRERFSAWTVIIIMLATMAAVVLLYALLGGFQYRL